MGRHSAVPPDDVIFFIWVGLGHYLLSFLHTLPGSEMENSCLINGLLWKMIKYTKIIHI